MTLEIIVKVVLIFLAVKSFVDFVNDALKRYKKIKTRLVPRTIAFWVCLGLAVAFFGWMSLVVVLAISYVDYKYLKK